MRVPECWDTADHATVGDGHFAGGLATLGADFFDAAYDVHAGADLESQATRGVRVRGSRFVGVSHLAEDHMLAVEVRCSNRGDKELGAVRVGPRVGHREKA